MGGAKAGENVAKGRMDRLTQRGKDVHGNAECGQAVAHVDRATAGMNPVNHDLAQAAATGGLTDEPAKCGDGWHRGELRKVLAFADELDHLVHKAVEPDGDGRKPA